MLLKADKNRISIEKGSLPWLVSVIKPYTGRIFFLIVLDSVKAILQLFHAIFIREMINAAVAGNRETFSFYALWMMISILANIVCHSAFQYYSSLTESKINLGLRQRMFEKLLSGGFAEVRGQHSAEWMNRLTGDAVRVSQTITHKLPDFVGMLLKFIGSIILLATLLPSILIIVVLGAVAVALIGGLMRRPYRKRQIALRQADGEQRTYYTEHLSQLMIVKAFSREKEISENAAELGEVFYLKERAKARLILWTNLGKSAGMTLVYYAAYIYAAYQILLGILGYGDFTMLLQLVNHVRNPLASAASYLVAYFDLMVSAERIREADLLPRDPAVPLLSEKESRAFYQDELKAISLRDVSFVYQDELPEGGVIASPIVFSHVNISIPRGSCTAITGITGSGKSTLFKLLLSLYPLESGRCLLETKTGEPRELDASYRRLFAFVPQGNQLMSGSIREIICFGRREDMQNTEAIRRALDHACALSFVEKLPQGLDTVLKEKGLGLSEGQLQRLAIARALFTERPILLLDEATSSLDGETERQLLENIKKLKDRTILIVTHRSAALSICDQEICVEEGQVSLRSLKA